MRREGKPAYDRVEGLRLSTRQYQTALHGFRRCSSGGRVFRTMMRDAVEQLELPRDPTRRIVLPRLGVAVFKAEIAPPPPSRQSHSVGA